MTAKSRTRISFRAINYHEAGAGLRSLVAWQLRALADRLDKHHSVAARISTTPALSRRVKTECIIRGMAHSHRLIEESVRARAVDDPMREHCPELYSEESQMTPTHARAHHGTPEGDDHGDH